MHKHVHTGTMMWWIAVHSLNILTMFMPVVTYPYMNILTDFSKVLRVKMEVLIILQQQCKADVTVRHEHICRC